MKRMETALLGGLIGAIAGVVARQDAAVSWWVVAACCAIGAVVGLAWAIVRR